VGFLAILFCCGCACAQDLIQIHGYIQGRYTNEESTPDLLEIRRARVILSGTPLSRLTYRLQADLVKRPYLMDAALTWRFAPTLSVSAGQMKIPFSAESIVSDNLNAPVARSRAVLALAPGRDTGVQARDVGVLASGGLERNRESLFEYAAGVFRGQTFVSAPKVHFNATVFRLVAHPIHGLSLGADWYGSFSAPPHQEKRREGVETEYRHGRYTVRAEEIWARDGILDRRGGYTVGIMRVTKNWEAVTRADWLTTNVHLADTGSIAYMGGANRFLFDHVKVGLDAGGQHDSGPRGWSSVFFAQVMVFY
jgi:hypothetical protein